MNIRLYPLTLVFLILVNCSDNDSDSKRFEWKKLGLADHVVNEMVLKGEMLYAATDKGLFKKNINTTSDFISIGLSNKNIEDVIVFANDDLLVTFVDRTFTTTHALYYSGDGGTTWEIIENNFGGETGNEPIYDLCLHPTNENLIYASGNGVVARSLDKGETWEPLWGQWEGFATGVAIVTVNPQNPAEIWAGGQGAIENGFLLRSGNSTDWYTWDDLVPNPTVVKEIVFDQQADQHVYVGFEGALLSTSNEGETWNTLIDSEENRFFFGIAVSGQNHRHVFSGGWLKRFDEPQPLKLFYSLNRGEDWKEETFSNESFGGVYDMTIKSEPGRERIFLGLYKGGVYEVVFKP